jgi:hypothetical protein
MTRASVCFSRRPILRVLWLLSHSFALRRRVVRFWTWCDTDRTAVAFRNFFYWSRPDRWALWLDVRRRVRLLRRGITEVEA